MLGRMKLGVKSLSGLLGICSLIGMAIKIKRRWSNDNYAEKIH